MRDTKVQLAKVYPPGTTVYYDDTSSGRWVGRVVVCLCKRHTWQPDVCGDSGPGRECGHDRCGYGPPTDAACPWPMHVDWGFTESHEGPGSVTPLHLANGDDLTDVRRALIAPPF